MSRWFRSGLFIAGLVAIAVAALGCGGSPVEYVPTKYGSFEGTAEVSGPIPVYYTYDGTSPLSAGVGAGLFTPGTNQRVVGSSLSKGWGEDRTPNFGGPQQFYFEFSEYIVPPGTYDLALYAAGPPAIFPGRMYHELSPLAIPLRQTVVIDYLFEGDSGIDLKVNFTGSGPYGTVSGRLLLSGNPIRAMKPGIVLFPDAPAPGVDPGTGLLWEVDLSGSWHGDYHFTVSDVQLGKYNIGFSGESFTLDQEALPPVIDLTNAQPDASGIIIRVTNYQPAIRPYELGEIRGTVQLPAGYDPGLDYVVEAIRQPQAYQDSNINLSTYSRAVAIIKEWDAGNQADYFLGWLADGTYDISVYQLAQNGAAHDVELLELAHEVVIESGNRAIENVVLEAE